MVRLIALLLLSAAIYAVETVEVPDWVLVGILSVESRSYYADDGIVYIDRRRGRHGERGPFQMTRIAFNQIAKPGERFESLSTDLDLAEDCAKRYLVWLHVNFSRRQWTRTVMMYNAGPGRISRTYLNRVKDASK